MENLKNKIVELFNEHRDFEVLVKEKSKIITDKNNSLQDLIKDKSLEELENLLVYVYVDTILYNKDLQILFSKLITNIETYLEFSKEPLPEEVMDFYNSMKSWYPKRTFTIEKEQLVETEVGILEKSRKEFLESDFFKGLLEKAKN